MKSITIHALDNTLDKFLRDKAVQEGTSINKTIKELLRQSLGLSGKQVNFDFSEFSGVWTPEEFAEFERSIRDFEKIDRKDWK